VTVRWGIAGPGRIATSFAEDLARVDDAPLVAVASRSQARADAFGARFGIAARYSDADAMAADPDVDVVYVASPHSAHEADTLRYVEAGKHVLCEKPLALNARQAQCMADAARGRGVFLMEAMWSRFLPAYRVLRDTLDERRVGEPLLVESDFGYRAPFDPSERHFDRAVGGGALLDLGVYPIQLCSFVLGTPDRVVADGLLGETHVDELVAAVLHHRGGALGVVKAALRVPMACTARIAGSDGWVALPAFAHCPEWIELAVAGRAVERIDASFEGNGLRFEVDEVHRCLAAGRGESDVMPLDESIAIAATMDDIRRQIGVTYPADEAW
jgi:predicted dehydrogenase